ncbi:MAG: endonuclease domain-containing protein [Candidatus Glassbacteria bacterium]|nr:endonuclease domain-containing protein [Candidatus Glassbacteria bacterium]
MKIHYNSKLKTLSRKLRKNSTLVEVLLWEQLKARKLRGYQFARQKPVGDFIVDFFCHDLHLVIEIDGSSHDKRLEQDKARQGFLESLGMKVIRFLDKDAKSNIQGVVSQLELVIDAFEEKKKDLGI